MTFEDTRKILDELETITRDFLLLFQLLPDGDDLFFSSTDCNHLFSGYSLSGDDTDGTQFHPIDLTSRMEELRSTRLFTPPTPYDDKTVQTCFPLMDGAKNTNFNAFLFSKDENPNLTQAFNNLCVPITAGRLLSYAIVNFFEDHCSPIVLKDLKTSISKYQNELITIFCGVISPRPLNGLNQCKLDDDFQIAAQVQNMRE